jgi:hypothetical protein
LSEQSEAVQAGEPVTIQPAGQPPIQQPQGDRNYVEGPDGTMTEQPADEQPAAEGTSNESAPDPLPEVLPDPSGQPPGAVVTEPPAGGPGEQSLAERQAGGQQAEADVPQPEAGPGGSSPYAQPAASYPAESVTADDGQAWQPPVGNATSNESPMLPGNLTSGAARAHAALSKADEVTGNGDMTEGERLSELRKIVDFAARELDRFLPTHVRQPAADEVNREL